MQKEPVNKWAILLDQPTAELLNKEAAWEKLQQKLSARKKKKRFLLVRWAAAIAILFSLGIYIWSVNRSAPKDLSLLKEIKFATAPALKQNVAAQTAEKNISKSINVQADASVSLQDKINKQQPAVVQTTTVNEETQKNFTFINEKKEQADVIVSTNENNTVVEINPVKKIKKVVHINELENQPVNIIGAQQQTENTVAIRQKLSPLRKTLNTHEEFGEQETAPAPSRKKRLSIGSIIASKEQ